MGTGMDAILFATKRAHLVLQHRLAAKALAETALTPARFDALYFLASCSGVITQAKFRRAFGVAGATASRMLRALERLKMVERGSWRRGCSRAVRISRIGRKALKHAMRRTMRRDRIRRWIDYVLEPHGDRQFAVREGHEDICNRVRRALGDDGPWIYLWHPDD
jgi:DNA-binding MarR family transcriptional regulator